MMRKWFQKKNASSNEKCYVSHKDGMTVELQRIGYRQFYDATWEIVVKFGECVVQAAIVRDDMETAEELDAAVRCFGTVDKEALLSLDRRHFIYYD